MFIETSRPTDLLMAMGTLSVGLIRVELSAPTHHHTKGICSSAAVASGVSNER